MAPPPGTGGPGGCICGGTSGAVAAGSGALDMTKPTLRRSPRQEAGPSGSLSTQLTSHFVTFPVSLRLSTSGLLPGFAALSALPGLDTSVGTRPCPGRVCQPWGHRSRTCPSSGSDPAGSHPCMSPEGEKAVPRGCSWETVLWPVPQAGWMCPVARKGFRNGAPGRGPWDDAWTPREPTVGSEQTPQEGTFQLKA